jgi:Cysteine-rich secretory protein family
MKQLILCILTILGTASAFAQTNINIEKNAAYSTDNKINQLDPNAYLFSKEELETLSIINEMRADPSGFYKTYIAPYIALNPRFTKYYTRSLQKTMLSLPPLAPLSISPVMKKTADYLAKDLLIYGGRRLDHTSSRGETFEQRMQKAGVGCAGENLYTGQDRTPMMMIMDLLIDQGVESLGHREALLSKSYKSIGISIQSYPDNGQLMVQDFSCNQ